MTLLAGDKTRQMVFQSPVCKTQFIGIAVDDVSDGMQTVQNIFGHDQAGLQASDIGARTDSAWLSVNFGILVIHLDPAPRLFEKNLLRDSLPVLPYGKKRAVGTWGRTVEKNAVTGIPRFRQRKSFRSSPIHPSYFVCVEINNACKCITGFYDEFFNGGHGVLIGNGLRFSVMALTIIAYVSYRQCINFNTIKKDPDNQFIPN